MATENFPDILSRLNGAVPALNGSAPVGMMNPERFSTAPPAGSGASVGEDCNICDHTFNEDWVRIGNHVTLKCGLFLWDGITPLNILLAFRRITCFSMHEPY